MAATNLTCTACFGRWYSAAANGLVGKSCINAGCTGTLVACERAASLTSAYRSRDRRRA